MYKIGDKVETPIGIGIIKWIDKASKNDDEGFDTLYVSINGFPEIEVNERHIKPYRTAHEKLIEMGWEDKGYVSDARRYEGYNMWVIFNVTNKTYTINKLVGIAIICPNIDITLSRILTQYLEELHETHTSLQNTPMVLWCDVYCGRGGDRVGVLLNLITHPLLFAICMALGVIGASALCIWISVRKKEK